MRLVRLEVRVDVLGVVFWINGAEDPVATSVVGILVDNLNGVGCPSLECGERQIDAIAVPVWCVDQRSVDPERLDGATAKAEEG